MKDLQRDFIQNYPGGGYNPEQRTFILKWNPAISSYTIHNHIDSVAHIDNWEFNWSVYEWEKAHNGDRFFMVRVGEGKTGVVMSGIFISEPYPRRDWNRIRKTKEIYYMDMQPNFIVNPETMPIITTEQLQEAIPVFDWSKGHSGMLLSEYQARKLEELIASYLSDVSGKADDENLAIKHLMDLHDLNCINAVLQANAEKFFQTIDEKPLNPNLMTDTQIIPFVKFPIHHITMCWDVLLSKLDRFSEEYQETVSRKKSQNDRIKEYFTKNFGLEMESIYYADYRSCFYCDDPEDTIEDFIWESESDLLEKGFSKKDIDLYCSVRKMDFDTVKRLLEVGASPEIVFVEDEDEAYQNCWDWVREERTYFSEKLDNKVIGEDVTPFRTYEVENFIGYAAYESMYSLLKPYIKEQ